MPVKDDALNYLKKGYTVIPLRGRYGVSYDDAKRPLVKWERWQGKKPSLDIVESWFNRKPDMDLGVLTGSKAGIFVLDVDGPEGLKTVQGLDLPATVVNITPHGFQHIFRWDDRLTGLPTNLVKPFPDLPGIDTRGEGGYIVVPPSLNRGDQVYAWKDGKSLINQDLAMVPDWLVKRLVERSAKEYTDAPEVETDGWLAKLKEGVSEGENRHKAMCRLVSFYMSRGIPEDDVITLMILWNSKCQPPKEEKVFLEKLNQFLDNWREGKYKSTYKEPKTKFEVKKSNDFINGGDLKIDWLVEGMIPVESIGFLHGYGGQGKSWLSLDLAIEVGRGGGQWLDRFKTNGGKVLYIDEESHPTLLRTRYNKLIKGKGLHPSQVDVSFLSLQELKLDQPETLDAFRGLLVELKPALVIIDPFVAIHSMNENSTEHMAKLRTTLKALVKDCQTSFLFLDHESKPSEYQKSASQRQRGSTEKDAVADVKFAVSNNMKVFNPKGFKVLFEHSKSRMGLSVDPFSVHCLDKDADQTVITYGGEATFEDVR